MMSDLKPCPFCGAIAHMATLKQKAVDRFFVCCSNAHCIASEHWTFGRHYYRRVDAAMAWNRRANDEKI